LIPVHKLSKYDREYEKFLRSHITFHQVEKRHREKRQELKAKLSSLLTERGVIRLRHGCPPAHAYDCILLDGTKCPHYNDGECEKEEEQ
jgi:hypothetical protein